MKLKELNLNKPHYIIAIWTSDSKVLVTKAKYSTIEKSKYLSPQIDCFFIYPCQESKNSYVDKPIVSLSADPEEEIYVGGHYIRFNRNRRYQLNYITFDLITMIQLIRDYFKKQYNIVRQTEGVVYRNGYSKDIQGMYKHYLNQIKKYLM